MSSRDHKTGDYNAPYYAALQAGARASANQVMPRVLNLVAPLSIVDFGCGSGAWLATALALGIADIQGVDGPWVTPSTLQIEPERFQSADLGGTVDLGRRFDLALCLEVAEHLLPEAARALVATLTAHAPVILFSAAVPGQGGEGHVNEAWPSSWRALFAARGFDCFDILRGPIWEETAIEPWYRQNLLIFAARDRLDEDRALATRLSEATPRPFDIAHPAVLAMQTARAASAVKETYDLIARLEDLGSAYEEQRAEIVRTRNELEDLRGSLSWRLTAALRAVGSAFRSLRQS
jgi:SAM-dependent methyltransferase